MPGSVQVSVLDFKELPSSSNSVKISLGKVEYEAVEKETFSFPLPNLRDNLLISVQDSEGNQVSHAGVRTVSILEKGVWDDVFAMEGGGLIRMKLEFILSDEERNRIRLVRESAMKKKQAEILGSRLRSDENAKFLALSLHKHQVSDVLKATSSQDFNRSSFNNDTLLEASESVDGITEESVQRQAFTNATEEIEQNPSGSLVEKSYVQNLEDKISSDANKTKEDNTTKNNEFSLQEAEVPKKLLEDTKTRDFLKDNNAVKTIPVDNLVEKLDQQNLKDRNLSLKKMSNEKKFSQETEVNTSKINEIQLQATDLSKRLKDSSSSEVGSTRLTVAEKIKSFSPKFSGELDKQASLEKTPQNIKKMISVFESSLSKDRVPLKPLSTKSNRFGTSRLLKDAESTLKNPETSSSSRLRNSFSTGDLRNNLSSIITKENQDEINMQLEGNDLNGTENMPKEAQGDKTMSELSDSTTEEKCHQEKIVDALPEIVVKGEENERSESADTDSSNGSFGQVMKIALVIGFGVVVLLFRPRESRKGKNMENTRASRNTMLMNKRGSIEEQRRRIGVSWSS